MEFKHFLGNEKIKAQLSALVDGGRLPHAVVLEGESGLGKRTLAGELAAALVCRGEHRPCDSCPQCHKARAGVHPDILVYAPEGGARSFHKKTVDQIVGDVYMTPNEADYKIYILVNAHLMSVQAQNAILKVLEEPPAYVRFILTVENKSALLPTVLYGGIILWLNIQRVVDGPYPFMKVYDQSVQASVLWCIAILLMNYFYAWLLWKLNGGKKENA